MTFDTIAFTQDELDNAFKLTLYVQSDFAIMTLYYRK